MHPETIVVSKHLGIMGVLRVQDPRKDCGPPVGAEVLSGGHSS